MTLLGGELVGGEVTSIRTPLCIQLFRERLSEKKTSKCTRRDRKVVWVFTGILHIGLEEIYKFVFLHVENLFFLSGGHICSFTFTVACL